MFHSLMVSSKSLCAHNECIYSEYKICMEKCIRLKQILKQKSETINMMKRKIKRMECEMHTMADMSTKSIERKDVADECTQTGLVDKKPQDDMDDSFELVCV